MAPDLTELPSGSIQVARKYKSRASSSVYRTSPLSGSSVLSRRGSFSHSRSRTLPVLSAMCPVTSANCPGPDTLTEYPNLRVTSPSAKCCPRGQHPTSSDRPRDSRAVRNCCQAMKSVAEATTSAVSAMASAASIQELPTLCGLDTRHVVGGVSPFLAGSHSVGAGSDSPRLLLRGCRAVMATRSPNTKLPASTVRVGWARNQVRSKVS